MNKNRKISIFFLILYVFLLSASVLLLYKSGASIFYKKIPISLSQITSSDQAYFIKLNLGSKIYNADSIVVFDRGSGLSPASIGKTRSGLLGSYAFEKLENNSVNLYFVPEGGMNSSLNDGQILVFVHPYLISSNSGGVIFVVINSALMVLLFILKKNKKENINSTNKIVASQEGTVSFKEKLKIKNRISIIRNGLVNTIFIAYLYIFLEWLFYVSNPSFMEVLTLWKKIEVLLIISLSMAVFLLLSFPILFIVDVFFLPYKSKIRVYLYEIPTAFLATFLFFSLMDNITYTYFHFGIITSRLIIRAMYALLFVGLLLFILDKISISAKLIIKKNTLKLKEWCVYSVTVFTLIIVGTAYSSTNTVSTSILGKVNTKDLPNIILLATDGLSSQNMSVYGYDRDTTPYLNELAKVSLVAENNFTNATTSMGSESSILTGKSPFSTRVIYTPDTLRGKDMYQSLPGILRQYGYKTASLGVKYFVDVNTMGFQNAFDEVNCQSNNSDGIANGLNEHGFENEVKFFTIIQQKIRDRLLHISFIKDMENSYADVTQPMTFTLSDEKKENCLYSYLDDAKSTGQPLFVQLHLMGTHGPKFNHNTDMFTEGEEQNETWMTDFYDDSILDYDTLVKNLVQHLQENGQYENTILVLYTDHPHQWIVNKRTPLIIHFPNDQFARVMNENTQNLDIAPTITDYLQITPTYKFEGDSLLENIDPKRLIIAGIPKNHETEYGVMTIPKSAYTPPFYQFSQISVTQCQNNYVIDFANLSIEKREVEQYVNPCDPSDLFTSEEIKQKVGQYLVQEGFILPENW